MATGCRSRHVYSTSLIQTKWSLFKELKLIFQLDAGGRMHIDHFFLRWWRENYFFCPLVPTLPQWLRWLTLPTFHMGITQVISDLFIIYVSSGDVFGAF